MQKNIERRVCDECEREREYTDELVIGGCGKFAGWLKVTESSRAEYRIKTYDFCCKECAGKFFSKKVV